MKLKLCPKCKKPYLESHPACPNCKDAYKWDQESWMNLGCLLMGVVPVLIVVFLWLLFFFGLFFR